MRLFEALLIGSNLFLLVVLLFMRNRKIGLGAGFAAICALSAHLIWEGYRWQLAPSYLVSVILFILVAIRIYRNPKSVNLRKKTRYIGYSVLTVLLGFSVFLAQAVPILVLPKPGGEAAVGTQLFHFTDSTRQDSYPNLPKNDRELMVRVWYPAKPQPGKGELLFPEDPVQFKTYKENFSGVFGLPAFILDYWKYTRGNSRLNAELLPASAPYPLVLISHGMGTGSVLHVSQAENLASHGFIVAAIDHTYSTAATLFPDGRITGFETKTPANDFYAYAKRVGAVWAADIQFVLSEMEHLNQDPESSLKGMIDVNHTGIMGHSFGGGTAFNVTYSSDKIKAGIDMDGTLYDLEDKGQMPKPFMFLNSDKRSTLSAAIKNNEVPDSIRAQLVKEQQAMDSIGARNGQVIHIRGTDHFNFTDLQFYTPMLKYTGMTGDIDGYRGAALVNSYVLDFFTRHLKKNGGKPL
ncbi:acetylhydrolase [Paenibacillus chitinolyticus]|uniref:Acetylhydrolase n=1 Tax=Paenibacillus chitinolyticus TaxID=79263 RepID=A0A410WYE4_9BACL|nr:acetylhydrolase [Paenibacillus chitinolyticus]MCY9590544.1 acetylhydrolase [Paenibacillus chitinolyticus]MCY9596461.1 acetylhydrolase [Paenibacillus chitinolyticus]QAV19475.1 acetylhydrolase [Paenibacillus chitinolyticus]